jgi:hypothetical protein
MVMEPIRYRSHRALFSCIVGPLIDNKTVLLEKDKRRASHHRDMLYYYCYLRMLLFHWFVISSLTP